MPEAKDTAEAALRRVQAIMRRWPRPEAGQAVVAAAVADGLAPLGTLAAMVLKLPVGYGKGYYEGAGYLSGSSKITASDHDLCSSLLNDIDTLRAAGDGATITRSVYALIKDRAYKLLNLATDLDVTAVRLAKVGTAASSAWDSWEALAVVDEKKRGAAYGADAASTPMAQKAEAAVQRTVRFVNSFPKPGPDQGVKANYVLRALEILLPVIERVATQPLGAPKGSIQGGDAVNTALRLAFPWFTAVEAAEGTATPATGYLSGSPVITVADLALAGGLLDWIKTGLPAYGERPLERGQYEMIKERTHRVLAVATDLDLDTTAADQVALFWQSVKEAVKDLRKPVDAGFNFLKGLFVVAAIAGGVYVGHTLLSDR